ncbi:MAG: hypothetical protein FWB86_05290 [Treponema sp.]|nr:hypothetical protein [Treponema sp.]
MSKKRYYYDVPNHVTISEAADLYRTMATGIVTKTDYLDEKNQIIFDTLIHLTTQCGFIGTKELIAYLTEFKVLEAAGGLAYVQKVFNGLEPAEALCA